MWRNVIGQSIFQIIVLLVLLFCGGDIFGIDYHKEDDFYISADYIKEQCNAVDAPYYGQECPWYDHQPTEKTRLYTIVFQAFVFMQLFNQINSRKLGEREFNVFANFFNNPMFLFITVLTFAVQIMIVQYGGEYMRAVPLTWEENGVCAIIGAFSLIVGLLLKCVPARWFEWIRLEESEMQEEDEQHGMVASLKKSRTMRAASQRGSNRKVRFEEDDDFKPDIND